MVLRKKLPPSESPHWQRRIVSAPTHQTRKIHVGNGVRHFTGDSTPQDRLYVNVTWIHHPWT
ncbi:unnamed protein product [Thlaspi arvense]|uniref:Uncharacterized protein n=1 Tax=Thlaspi arvense TaxID=13288 RepID=A0AAU9R9G9_THLAR|nr:unnamed protein product [Thlaspi arvense]